MSNLPGRSPFVVASRGVLSFVVALLAVTAACTTPAAAEDATGGTVRALPVIGAIVEGFDPPATPYGPGHRGVRIAAAEGSVVRAPGGGVIHHAGPVAAVGWVTIDHGSSLLSSYGPVVPLVRRGDTVVAGQPIGRLDEALEGVDTPLRRDLDHGLHWGVRSGGVYIDPLVALAPRSSLIGPGGLAMVVTGG